VAGDCENCGDESIFLGIFGGNPVLKVLDFFMVCEDFDYSMVSIARNSGIGYSTLKLLWPELMGLGIVIQTRAVGKAKLFKLNKENEIVKRFKTFYWAVTRAETEKLLEKEYGQKVKAVVGTSKRIKN